VIVGIIRQKPVLTHASIVFGGMLASVNLVNSVRYTKLKYAVIRQAYNQHIANLVSSDPLDTVEHFN